MPRLPVEIICLLPYQCIKTKPQLTGLLLDRGRTVLKMKIWIQLKKGPHLTLQMGPSSLHVQKEHMSWKMVPPSCLKASCIEVLFLYSQRPKKFVPFVLFNVRSLCEHLFGSPVYTWKTLICMQHWAFIDMKSIMFDRTVSRWHSATGHRQVNTYGWKKSLFPGLNRHPLFFLFIPVTVWERQQSLMYGRAFLESNSHTAKKPGVPSVLVVVASKRQVHIWSFYGDTTNDKMNLLIKVDCGVGVVMALKKCSEIQTISPVLCSPISVPHSKKQIGEKSSSSFS